MEYDTRVRLVVALLLIPFLVFHLLMIYRETVQLGPISPEDTSRYQDRLATGVVEGGEVNWSYKQRLRQSFLQKGCGLTVGKKRSPKELWTTKEGRRHLQHILVDDRHRALYCYVPKVACTNWKRVWMLLTGRSNASSPLDIPSSVPHQPGAVKALSEYYKSTDDIRIRLETYKKFIFVRHPMERLVSAFRNKLEKDVPVQFRSVGAEILRRHRKHFNASSSNFSVTFPEFVRFLLNKKLRRREQVNEHWATYAELCHPCIIPYDYIGKYETLHEDAKNILQEIRADSEVQFPPLQQSVTSSLVSRYLERLLPTEQRRLYSLFYADFVIFNYRIPSVKNMTIP